MRQRRRTASPRHPLANLGDLRLRHERDVSGHLADGARGDAEGPGQLADACSVGVPGDLRLGEPELLRERTQHGRTVIAERGERSHSAAELHGEPLAPDGVQAIGDLVERLGPPGRLEPERDRERVLQQRSPGHQGLAVAEGDFRGRVGGGAQIVEQRTERPLRDQHRRGVQDVLTRRAAMHEVGGGRILQAPLSARTSGTTGFPLSAASRPIAAMSKFSARHARAIDSARS